MVFGFKQTLLDQYLVINKTKLTQGPSSQPDNFFKGRCKKIIPFVRDARVLSHPLYLATGNWKNVNYRLDIATGIKKVCESKFQLIGNLFHHRTAMHNNGGRELFVTCISMDQLGRWVAVGFMNGHIRIYESCHFRRLMTNNSLSHKIHPFRIIDTKQAVRALIWRFADDKIELMVGFNFSGNIFVYDIGRIRLNEDVVLVHSVNEGTMPDRTLDSSGISRESGFLCMVSVQITRNRGDTVVSNPNVRKGIFSRANASSKTIPTKSPVNGAGISRLEQTKDDLLIAGTISGYIRCWKLNNGGNSQKQIWSVKADPHRPANQVYEVIALWMITEEYLLGITNDGTFTCWDLTKLSPSTFGSGMRDPLCYNTFNIATCLTVFYKGNEIRRKIVRAEPYSNKSFGVANIMIDDGTIFNIDIFSRSIVLLRTDSFNSLIKWKPSDNEGSLSETFQKLSLKTMTTFELIPGWVGILSSTEMHCGLLTTSNVMDDIDRTRCSPVLSSEGRFDSLLCKTLQCSYVLNSKIESAIPGNLEIYVEDEMNEYLVGHKMSDSILNKSCSLELEYFENGLRRIWNAEVLSITGRRITLRDEYLGPEIQQGVPLVRMKTNLKCGSLVKAIELSPNISKPYSVIEIFPESCNSALPMVNVFSLPALQMLAISSIDGTLSLFGFKGMNLDEIENGIFDIEDKHEMDRKVGEEFFHCYFFSF
jgi:hypothetical protein